MPLNSPLNNLSSNNLSLGEAGGRIGRQFVKPYNLLRGDKEPDPHYIDSMINLNKFKSSVVDFARTNRFDFYFSHPPKFGNFSNIQNFSHSETTTPTNGRAKMAEKLKDYLKFSCKSVETPRSSFETLSSYKNGIYRKIAGIRDFDPINCEFYVDSDFLIKQYFESWHRLIFDVKTRSRTYAADHQSKQAMISIYDNAGWEKKASTIKLTNIWPSEIGSVRLDWQNENEIYILPVTFQYEYIWNDFDHTIMEDSLADLSSNSYGENETGWNLDIRNEAPPFENGTAEHPRW